MLLWVGLGNPEPGMARQRHNAGFMALDAIAHRHGFSPWRQRFKGLFAEGTVGGVKVIALKPQTYMNDSGEAVQAALAFYKLEHDEITVFHDEMDLVPGKVRVKHGGGAAGHNGLRSIDRLTGSPNYWRVRIGVGHPDSRARVVGYVLGDIPKADQPLMSAVLEAIADSAPLLTKNRAEDFMTRVALLTQNAA